MKTNELGHNLSRLQIASKRTACFELMSRVKNACLGLDEGGWAFQTGKVFGEYLKELDAQEAELAKTKE